MKNTDGSIGHILKERREELGRTLEDAEKETRIRKIYLDNLENNRFSELPGHAYVKGFIRVYAGYLGLKSNHLLALLNDLQSVEAEPEGSVPAVISKPGIRAKHSADDDWRKFFLVFILVLGLGCLCYFLVAVFSTDEQGRDSAIKTTEAGGAQAEQGKPKAGPEKSKTAPEKSQISATDQAQSTGSEVIVPDQGSLKPVVVAKQKVQANLNLPVIPYDGASLRMLALADSSLIIKVDARKPHQYKLYDGLDLTWKIKQRVKVEFAASDVARFWLNGQEIELAGLKSFALQPAAE